MQNDLKDAPGVDAKDAGQEPLPTSLWTRVEGDDWPRFSGPSGNGKASERGILTDWTEEGLRIVWQAKLVRAMVLARPAEAATITSIASVTMLNWFA